MVISLWDISQCGISLWFWFAFLWWLTILNIILVLLTISIFSLRNIFSGLCLFLNWVICLFVEMKEIFIYSAVKSLVLLLFWWCPLKNKTFLFWWSPVYNFFCYLYFVIIYKKWLHGPSLQWYSPMFYSMNFIVLCLTFSFFIHSELMFVYWVR